MVPGLFSAHSRRLFPCLLVPVALFTSTSDTRHLLRMALAILFCWSLEHTTLICLSSLFSLLSAIKDTFHLSLF